MKEKKERVRVTCTTVRTFYRATIHDREDMDMFIARVPAGTETTGKTQVTSYESGQHNKYCADLLNITLLLLVLWTTVS